MEHCPVLLLADDEQGDEVDDEAGHGHRQDQLVEHVDGSAGVCLSHLRHRS